VYEEEPGFRPGPRVMTRAQARGDRAVLSIVDVSSQPPVRDNYSYVRSALDASRTDRLKLKMSRRGVWCT